MFCIKALISMKKTKGNNRIGTVQSRTAFLALLIVTFAVSSGISYYALKDKFAFESSFIADIESSIMKESQRQGDQDSARLYEAEPSSSKRIRGVVLRRDEMLVAAEGIIREYLANLNVRLLDLYLDKRGVIYIDFGGEIRKSFEGDASEELGIIGGLYRRLESVIPDLTALKILIDGRETETIGGHIDISKPIGEAIAKSIN